MWFLVHRATNVQWRFSLSIYYCDINSWKRRSFWRFFLFAVFKLARKTVFNWMSILNLVKPKIAVKRNRCHAWCELAIKWIKSQFYMFTNYIGFSKPNIFLSGVDKRLVKVFHMFLVILILIYLRHYFQRLCSSFIFWLIHSQLISDWIAYLSAHIVYFHCN